MPPAIYDYFLRGLSYLYERVYTKAYGQSATPPDIKNEFIRVQAEQFRQLQHRLEKLNASANTLTGQVNNLQGDLERRIQILELKQEPQSAGKKQIDKLKLN